MDDIEDLNLAFALLALPYHRGLAQRAAVERILRAQTVLTKDKRACRVTAVVTLCVGGRGLLLRISGERAIDPTVRSRKATKSLSACRAWAPLCVGGAAGGVFRSWLVLVTACGGRSDHLRCSVLERSLTLRQVLPDLVAIRCSVV